jgi:hypothetical protein
MTINNISSLALVALMLLVPASSQAYTPYNPQAQAVTPSSGLYSISFNLGHPKQDMYVPLRTQRTEKLDIQNKAVGFNFNTSQGGHSDISTSQAFVLSTAEIVGNMYKVPAGEGRQFTIIALLTLTEADPRAKYGLQITNLPFMIGDMTQGLNVHELGNYYTREIGLDAHK